MMNQYFAYLENSSLCYSQHTKLNAWHHSLSTNFNRFIIQKGLNLSIYYSCRPQIYYMQRSFFGEDLSPWQNHHQPNSVLFSATSLSFQRYKKQLKHKSNIQLPKKCSSPQPFKISKKKHFKPFPKSKQPKEEPSKIGYSLNNIEVVIQKKNEIKYVLNFFKRSPARSFRRRVLTEATIDTHEKCLEKISQKPIRNSRVRSTSVFL